MAKHIFIGHSAPAGQARLSLDQAAAALSAWLQSRPWIERCAVHLRASVQEANAMFQHLEEGPDVAVELWTSAEPMDWTAEAAAMPLTDVAGYHLDEHVEKGDGAYPQGPMAGVTLIAFMRPAPGVAMGDVRARYGRHAPLARRVHIGMDRYSRNWVDWVSTPGATPYFGVSILNFPTDEDYAERLYESHEGAQAVMYDVSGFVDFASLLSFNARTHVLR